MPYIGNIVQDFSVSTAMLNTDSVTSIKIDDGTIVNADINDSAAIAGTKISPDFGSQNIITTGTLACGDITSSDGNGNLTLKDNNHTGSNCEHLINFTASDDTSLMNIGTPFGSNNLFFKYGSTELVSIGTSGQVDFAGNVDCNAGLDVTGNTDVSGEITVGSANSRLAENNLRFNSTGDAFIDHNTTGQDIKFRVSNSSSLDKTPITIQSDGQVNVGGMQFYQSNNVAIPVDGARFKLGQNDDFGLRHDADGPTIFDDAGNQGFKVQLKELNITEYTGSTSKVFIDTNGQVGIGTTSPSNNNKLHLRLAASSIANPSNQSVLLVENTSNAWITIGSGTGSYGGILFGDSDSSDIGQIRYNHNGDNLEFVASSSVRMTIASDGKVLTDRTVSSTSGDHPALEIETICSGSEDTTFATGIDFKVDGVAKKRLAVTNGTGEGGGDWVFYRDNGVNQALLIDSSGRLLTGGASSFNGSTNADDLQIGASGQSNQTGISLGSAVASSLRFMDVANDSAGYVLYNHVIDEFTIASTGTVAFSAGGGNAVNIDSTGVKLPSGKGINFHNYGSGTDVNSNLLDDYEEGTFSWSSNSTSNGWPTNFTIGDQNNSYTKIGNLVTLKGGFTIGNASGTVAQGNYFDFDDSSLPFTVINKGAGTETVQTVGKFFIYQVLGGNVNASGHVVLVHGGYLRFFVTFTTNPNRTNTGGITYFINYTSSQ